MTQLKTSRLIDRLDKIYLHKIYLEATDELRRLHEVNRELVEALEMCIDNPWREGTVQYDVLIHEAKVVLAKARGTE
jgi:hypothetical protein